MTYAKLIPERKAEWLAALRLPVAEGGYRQGKGELRHLSPGDPTHAEYCCLGVASNLAASAGIHAWDNAVWPSAEVMDYFGLTNEANQHLAEMNDDDNPFMTIAKWIEENL